ncbi:ArsC/Spx/MgsR family protein [Lactococcus garvieae]|uniref:ArsC/Spx/MgsR family protein n=1 Tax=Lactococcus garvieae TaxID=1363 RepID=UPI00254F6F95|nr:ArsC/Spx/MgsR family protein [Lactococcus garvieae]
MIKIYSKKGCKSTQQSLNWFEKYRIKIDICNINQISKSDIIDLLCLSDRGVDSIVKKSSRTNPKNRERLKSLEEMNFNECVDYLIRYPKLLQTPIVIGEKKYLVGYDINEIRQFLPNKYRRKKL